MNPVWPALVVLFAPAGVAPLVVAVDTPAVEAGPAPTEVVRIKRDFGKPHFDLVIDAWADLETKRLDEARLWWVNTSEADRRKPLGRLIERLVKLQYRRLSSKVLTVAVAGDDKEFTFTVELGADGKIAAYVAVDGDDGAYIRKCRADRVHLIARRVLGMPVGITRVDVSCYDRGGVLHSGQVRHRAL